MNFLVFFLNSAILLFFIRALNLMGPKSISVPGIYLALSALPTISLLVPGLFNQVEGRYGVNDYMLAIILHTLAVSIGVFLAYVMFNNSKTPKRVWVDRVRLDRDHSRWIFFGALFLVVASFISQVATLQSIPILSVLRGESVADLTMARESGYKLEGSPIVYLWHFSRMVFVPYLAVLLFIGYYQNRKTKRLLLFLSVLLLSIMHNSLSGAKAPVAMIFLCLAVAYYYMGGKIRVGSAAFAVGLIFLFPFLIEYSYSDDSFGASLIYFSLKIAERFSFETFDRTLSYFDAYPHYFDYLGGRTNKLFTLFSGQSYFNVQNQVFLMRLEDVKEHLLHGSANAHFIGYMNADFGLKGVAASCLIVGLIIGAFDVYATRYVSGPTGLACYSIMGFIFWKLMGSQPTTVLFSHGASLCLLMIIFSSFKFKFDGSASARHGRIE